MKILVVSDNHGDSDILNELYMKYEDSIDLFVHCGDSELSNADTIWGVYHTVGGNMDFYDFKDSDVISTEEGNIVVAHGHLLNVHHSDAELIQLAKQNDAQLVCYGHTHVMDWHETDGINVLNPGSVRLPRGQYPFPSYAVVEWKDNQLAVQFYQRNHQPIDLSEIV